MLGGEVAVADTGEMLFSPRGAVDARLQMHLTASIVKSLSSLVFYFRHLANRGDFIIIDEPELNLHPDNQRKLTRLFAKAVRLLHQDHRRRREPAQRGRAAPLRAALRLTVDMLTLLQAIGEILRPALVQRGPIRLEEASPGSTCEAITLHKRGPACVVKPDQSAGGVCPRLDCAFRAATKRSMGQGG